jgi:hypothetical protein
MKKELWKKVKDFEDIYEVNYFGQVRRNGIVLKKIKNDHNYFQVNLSKNGKVYTRLIHRIVAIAFIPNPKNKPHINHIDNNTQNNIVSNLEWCTPSENRKHCIKQNRHKGQHKWELNTNSKITIEDAKKIRLLYKTGNYSQKELGKLYKLDQTTIWALVNNKTWKI